MSNESTYDPFLGLSTEPAPASYLVKLVREMFPDLGEPRQRPTDDGGTVHLFTGPADLEIRVGDWGDDEVKIGVQIVPAGKFLCTQGHGALINALGKHWEWSSENQDGQWRYQLVTRLSSEHLGGVRESLLREQLTRLRNWATEISSVPDADVDEQKLIKRYKPCAEDLAPVLPWRWDGAKGAELAQWAENTAPLLLGRINVTLLAPTSVEQHLALAVLAHALSRYGDASLGRVIRPSLDADRLLRLADKAPGVLAVPARILQAGINRYQMGDDIFNMLSCLSASGTPAVFHGTHADLEHVFHGGQGAINDPLQPTVCHLPDLPLDSIITFAVNLECRRKGLSGSHVQEELCREAADTLEGIYEEDARRLLEPTVAFLVQQAVGGVGTLAPRAFVKQLEARAETLGGTRPALRVTRLSSVRKRMVERITDPGFLPFLEANLLGQEPALREFHQKMVQEAVTRPPHQPLRIACVGEPGTGKSQCLKLLAKWLGMEDSENIDMAQLSSPQMAKTQLFGSSRGYVGSDEAGRLEHIAKSFGGAVVECSDLDHANPSVQSEVGDCFLSIFETGQAQSGMGTHFSCANCVFGFTLNLPEGKDERMYQRTGFGHMPNPEEVRRDVRRELKRMMSGAFWSRMGDPILFGPITDPGARIEIVRRALLEETEISLSNYGIEDAAITISSATATELVKTQPVPGSGSNARGLLDLARGPAANAVIIYMSAEPSKAANRFELMLNESGVLVLRPMNSNNQGER